MLFWVIEIEHGVRGDGQLCMVCAISYCRLVMATRSGDVDPTIPLYFQQHCGLSPADVDKLLNKQSGFKGLCDLTDLRAITTAGTPEAQLALEVSSVPYAPAHLSSIVSYC